MGRYIKDAEEVFSNLARCTIKRHLWKVFAYSKCIPEEDVKGWLINLNKHLYKLRTFNVPRKGKGFNYNRKQLRDKFFTYAMFGTQRDIELLVTKWFKRGFPKVFVSEKDRKRLMKLADKYVDLILNTHGKFTVTDNEVL